MWLFANLCNENLILLKFWGKIKKIRSHNQGDNGQLLWNLIKTIKIYLFQSIKIGLKFWQGRAIFDKWLSG